MKKIMVGLLVAGACFGMALPSVVNAADVNGEGSADVTVNGTIGMDNTDPTSPIEEGSDSWVNVTLDTATVFYNVNGQTSIESPTYSIKNNSGRPVAVSVEKFEHKSASDAYTPIRSLNLKIGDGTTSEKLIDSSTLNTTFASSPLVTLANKDGNFIEGDQSDLSKAETTFSYDGELTAASIAKTTPEFTMTLKLDVPTTPAWK